MKFSKLAIFLVFLFILASACAQTKSPSGLEGEKAKTTAPSSQQSSGQLSVSIKNFKFVPQDIVVRAGTKVVWTNEDSAPHIVESSDNSFKSDELSKGDTFSYTFTKAGKYDYICGIHPSMHGSVTVQ